MDNNEKKRIKVLSRGPIECCGFIYGPILTPYWETLAKIFKMVSANIHVVEVLEDGTEVKLTVENFKRDNTVTPVVEATPEVVEEVKEDIQEEVVEEVEVEPTVVEEVEDEIKLETIEPETTEEPVVEKTETRTTDEVNNRNSNRNKHNRR